MVKAAEERALILAGIQSIDRHLEKLNNSVARNTEMLGKHEVAIAVLCEKMTASQETNRTNWGSVRSVVVDIVKMLVAAVIGGLLAGRI